MNVSFFRFCVTAVLAAPLLLACGAEEAEVVDPIRAIKTITVADRGSGQERRFPGVVEAVDTVTLSFEVRGNTRDVNARLATGFRRARSWPPWTIRRLT